jgi:hypothetical protein
MTEPVGRSLHDADIARLFEKVNALDRVLTDKIEALDREIAGQLCSVDRRHTELATERNRAVDAALAAANEKAKSHNDVLGAMKEQRAAYVTKDEARMRFNSLAIAIGAVAAIFGILNAIRALGGG